MAKRFSLICSFRSFSMYLPIRILTNGGCLALCAPECLELCRISLTIPLRSSFLQFYEPILNSQNDTPRVSHYLFFPDTCLFSVVGPRTFSIGACCNGDGEAPPPFGDDFTRTPDAPFMTLTPTPFPLCRTSTRTYDSLK